MHHPIPAVPQHPAPPAGIECPFAVGDRVMYTNEYGAVFGPFTVTGFNHPQGDFYPNGIVYLDWHSHWYPVPVASLSPAN